MSCKFDELRQDLDSLGYRQKLHPESVPLVQKLLGDLHITTTNLQKYMKISQHALEERDLLELGSEPYKCDNAKLIKECNDLHIAFIHFKEQHEKIQRELRNQISALQIRLENCNLDKSKIMSQLQQLEKEKYRKASRSGLPKDQNVAKENKNLEISTALANADENNVKMKNEFKDLKEKHIKLTEDNVILQNQLVTRDEEISRLQSLLQGGRSLNAVGKDCCYQNVDGQMGLLQDEVTRLKKEKNDIRNQVKEALCKQHEAMRRALHLAERNRQLEKEMRDIDEIALAVETECNNTVKGNTEKVTRLQDRINESLILIQNLERDNAKLKQDKVKLSADLDTVILEKVHLQKQLDNETNDKKRLNDRINNFTIIENDLNLEIDRLTKLTAEQKRIIVELESQVTGASQNKFYQQNNGAIEMSEKVAQTIHKKGSSKQKKVESKKSTKKVAAKDKSPSKSSSLTRKLSVNADPTKSSQKCCCESETCIKNLKDLLDKEMEYRQVQAMQSIEVLKQEKDYYMKEYHRALEQMRNVPTHERPDSVQTLASMQEVMEYKQQLKEKDRVIKELENEINQIKSSQLRGQELDMGSSVCKNPNCKRRERELDIKTKDLSHLDIENNTLKSRLQAINETTVFNEERMKKAFQDMEEHIRKLEDERRDLVKTEVTHRSNISQLEEDYKTVKEQLRQTQNDLNNQRANYNQLKLLHEQTDRALSDAQAQIVRAETELVNYQSRVRDSNRGTAAYDREIAKLTSDVQIMRNQLTKLDKEKDDLLNNLDEKTEKIASLESELNSKNKSIARLEAELKELKRKLSKTVDESSSQEHAVRSARQDLVALEQDLDKEKRVKESALLENRRLQSDLTAITCDCRDARNELDISRRQVEDLKRQLQHYVAEVKRTEDQISNKELERAELLDQFRCLSQEAGILESNNHTLENEATQSKVQLSVALDHTSELERRLENQESIIRSYEKQISDLTTQVARLELQLKQTNREYEQYNTEMKQMRDLCCKLDKDKDSLKHELYSKDDRRSQIQKGTEKLESEKVALQRALEKERTSLEAVEKLLSDARQEVMEQRLLNQDLQSEVSRLKQKIAELQERLHITGKPEYKKKSVEISPPPSTNRCIGLVPFPVGKALPTHHEKVHEPFINSTKTLTSLDEYHGSDGILQGNIDLTQLENDLKPPSRMHSPLSTKSLTLSASKYKRSDEAIRGATDLTNVDNNVILPSRAVSAQSSRVEIISVNPRKTKDIVHFSDNEDIATRQGQMHQHPCRTRSALSTKTLTSIKEYHGSDGFLSGNIDLTKLDIDSDPILSTASLNTLTLPVGKYHGSDGQLYGTINFTQLANGITPVPENVSAHSTNTHRYHGDDILKGAKNVTILNKGNVDCHDECDRYECPLHQKLFLESNPIGNESKCTNRSADISEKGAKVLRCGKEKLEETTKQKNGTKKAPERKPVDLGKRGSKRMPSDESHEICRQANNPPLSPPPPDISQGSYEVFDMPNILNYLSDDLAIMESKIDRDNIRNANKLKLAVRAKDCPDNCTETCSGKDNNASSNKPDISTKKVNSKYSKNKISPHRLEGGMNGKAPIPQQLTSPSKRASNQEALEQDTKSQSPIATGTPTNSNANDPAQKTAEDQTSAQTSKPVSPSVTYDFIWNKCKCLECWSNESISETNVRGKCLTEGITATNKCHRRNIPERFKDKGKYVPKTPPEKRADLDKFKLDMVPNDACVRGVRHKESLKQGSPKNPKIKDKTLQAASTDAQADVNQSGSSNDPQHSKQIGVKTSPTIFPKAQAECNQNGAPKNPENPNILDKASQANCCYTGTQAEFSQKDDDSAVFQKVFSVNGVCLQCQCCISSFKIQDKH